MNDRGFPPLQCIMLFYCISYVLALSVGVVFFVLSATTIERDQQVYFYSFSVCALLLVIGAGLHPFSPRAHEIPVSPAPVTPASSCLVVRGPDEPAPAPTPDSPSTPRTLSAHSAPSSPLAPPAPPAPAPPAPPAPPALVSETAPSPAEQPLPVAGRKSWPQPWPMPVWQQ